MKERTELKEQIEIEMQPFPCVRVNARSRFNKRSNDYHVKLQELRLKVKISGFIPSETISIHFVYAMPKSWSKKKKALMDGKPHQQTPDIDNLVKSVLDSIYNGYLSKLNDSLVWKVEAFKTWGKTGKIIFY